MPAPHDGYIAASLGAKLPENPHRRGSKEYRKWAAKWHAWRTEQMENDACKRGENPR